MFFNFANQDGRTDIANAGIPPLAHVPLTAGHSLLQRNQPYSFVLDLELPRTHANRHRGVFMASLSLGHNASAASTIAGPTAATAAAAGALGHQPQAEDGYTVARPVMFPHHNLLVVWSRRAVLLIPQMLGLLSETERVRVPLFTSLTEIGTAPIRHAVLTLSDPGIHLYSATLFAHAEMSGLTYVCWL